MAHTTLASTDRALEKIGDFVAAQDYLSLKAVGRTFAQKAAVLVGFRRSIPRRYAKKAMGRTHGLHPNFVLNGRHVVVVPTPLDVAARGRINVVLDGAVHAVHRENLRAVATP